MLSQHRCSHAQPGVAHADLAGVAAADLLQPLPEAMSAIMFLTALEHLILFPSCSQSFSGLLKSWAGSSYI